MFFIAGITGHVGGAAARRLIAEGKQVRTLLRIPEKARAFADQGVEIQQGNLNDPEALARALEGVQGAFLLMQPTMTPPPDFNDAKASLASYTALSRKRRSRVWLPFHRWGQRRRRSSGISQRRR